MKNFFCFILILLIICLYVTSCCAESTSISDYPLRLIDEVKDQYNNLLQQILYNEETGDYMLREFTYKLERNKWVCVNQQTSIISCKEEPLATQASVNPMLKIYYNSDLVDGPITVMDNEYAKISIVKYLTEDYWWKFGYELKVINKTNSVITIMIDGASIMGINCKPLFSIDHIEAGNTAYFTLAWDEDTLNRSYIPYIDNIEFMVRVYDNEKWNDLALVGSKILLKK